jgi:Uma2 family endonuclease
MTALPQPTPQPAPQQPSFSRPYTVADYLALPENADRRFELQEGSLVMTPRPAWRHQKCIGELYTQLRTQIPAELDFASEVDIDLQLNPEGLPATVRVPDLVVVHRSAAVRLDTDGGLLQPDDVVLVVEIRSPRGGHRTDAVIKHAEYADSGIGHYWMIDLADGPSLTACHSGGEFGYVDAEPVKGVFETDTPFPARVDLTALI